MNPSFLRQNEPAGRLGAMQTCTPSCGLLVKVLFPFSCSKGLVCCSWMVVVFVSEFPKGCIIPIHSINSAIWGETVTSLERVIYYKVKMGHSHTYRSDWDRDKSEPFPQWPPQGECNLHLAGMEWGCWDAHRAGTVTF